MLIKDFFQKLQPTKNSLSWIFRLDRNSRFKLQGSGIDTVQHHQGVAGLHPVDGVLHYAEGSVFRGSGIAVIAISGNIVIARF